MRCVQPVHSHVARRVRRTMRKLPKYEHPYVTVKIKMLVQCAFLEYNADRTVIGMSKAAMSQILLSVNANDTVMSDKGITRGTINMKKKFTMLICVFMLTLAACFPAPGNTAALCRDSSAPKASCSKVYNGMLYEKTADGIVITGYTDELPAEPEIPEIIDDTPVTAIADNAFMLCEALISIKTAGITHIGEGAFDGCTRLTYANMPNVKTVGAAAFEQCLSLSSIIMPKLTEAAGDSFTSTPWFYNLREDFSIVGDGVLIAYKGNSAKITLPVGIKCVAGFYENNTITYINSENLSEGAVIADNAFSMCSNLNEAILPNITRIGNGAFSYCDSLYNVDTPSVTEVSSTAFLSCCEINDLSFPAVSSIGDFAFAECTNLKELFLGNACELGMGFINQCISLTEVTFSEDNLLFLFEDGALYSYNKSVLIAYPTAIGDIEVKDCVTAIGAYAFAYCDTLESIRLSNVKLLECNAFMECFNLYEIDAPELTVIENDVFRGCSFESIALYNVTQIGANAFDSCFNLNYIEIPNVSSIGEFAFFSCYSLNKIHLYCVNRIYDGAFNNCQSLDGAYFFSAPPDEFGNCVFDECGEDFTVYFKAGTDGWTTPTWNSYNSEPFDSAPSDITPCEAGDINMDGIVNTGDATHLLYYIAELLDLTEEQLSLADVNKDLLVNTADAVAILRLSVGLAP